MRHLVCPCHSWRATLANRRSSSLRVRPLVFLLLSSFLIHHPTHLSASRSIPARPPALLSLSFSRSFLAVVVLASPPRAVTLHAHLLSRTFLRCRSLSLSHFLSTSICSRIVSFPLFLRCLPTRILCSPFTCSRRFRGVPSTRSSIAVPTHRTFVCL